MKVLSTTSNTFFRRQIALMAARSLLRIRSVDIGKLQAKSTHDLVEESRSSSVKIVPADDVISGFQHANDGVDGCHAAGKYAGGDSAFEGREILLEARTRGIGDARVF